MKSPINSTESKFFELSATSITNKLKLKSFLPSSRRGLSSCSKKPSFFKLSEKKITSDLENNLKTNKTNSEFIFGLNSKELQKAFDNYDDKKLKREKTVLSSVLKFKSNYFFNI